MYHLGMLRPVTAWSPVDLLPGLYVGLVGISLAALVRRWFDPLPARVVALFLLILGPLFGAALFGGKILLPLDNLRGHIPFERLQPTEPTGNVIQGDLLQLVLPSLVAVREGWGEGRWPLWNPRVGAGMPLLADPQAQALQPLVLLASPFPPARAAGVTAALRVLFALIFFFLFLRRQKIGEGPAVAGALAYGLGGFVLLWVGWPLANSAVWLPAVLWALGRCDEEGARRDTFLLTVTLLSLLLAGHPETILYALALAGAFLASRVRRRPLGLRGALLRRAAFAGVLALMLAAPLLLPAAELLPKSLRSARLHATETLADPPSFTAGFARRFLPLAVPNAYGNDRFASYWGLSNINEDAGGFAGTAMLLAFLAGLPGPFGRARRPQERTALAVLGLCLLLLAQPPGLARLFQALPLGAGLATRRLLLPVLACLAFLGASALERSRSGEVRGRARVVPILVAAGLLAGLIVWGTLTQTDPGDPDRLHLLRFGWLRWQLRFLALAFVALVAARRFRAVRGWAPWAIALCVAAELTLAHGPANSPMPPELYLPRTMTLRTLQYQLGIRPLEGFRMAALGRALPPNLSALYGLSDARIYNPMAPQAYFDLLAPVTVGWWGELPQLGSLGHPLYRRLGVRFLLARPGRRVPPGFAPLVQGEDAWVWEIPGARPFLYLGGTPSPGSLLIPRRLEAQRATGLVRLVTPSLLETTLYQDGGWRLLAAGRPIPTALDRGALLAAELPAGRFRLELLYRPASFLLGCLLAAAAFAVAAAAFVPPPGGRSRLA
jgi:hypothetical protein